MKVQIKKNKFYFLILFIVNFYSCDSRSVFDEYKSLENASWSKHKMIDFRFTVKDTVSKHNLFINLRNNKEYAYSNLYVITKIIFPNSTKIIDTLQYEMADANGRFLGKGFSEIKENKLFYKENIIFPVSGNYTFQISQSMRKNGYIEGIEQLEGIMDIGFRVEKSKK